MVSTGQNHSISMRGALLLKHLEPRVPPVSAFPCCDTLPLFEDVGVSGSLVQAVACRIQWSRGL